MNPSLGLVSGCAAFIPLSVSLRLARVDSIRYCATIVALRLLPSKQCTRTELAGSVSAPDEGDAPRMDAENLLRDILGGQSVVLEGPDVSILEIVGAVQHVCHAESSTCAPR